MDMPQQAMLADLAADRVPSFLAGGGEIGRLIAAYDWSATSLGPITGWPAHRRAAIATLLRAPAPMASWWNKDGVILYNAACADLLAPLHPDLLGRTAAAWPQFTLSSAQILARVLSGGTCADHGQKLRLPGAEISEPVWLNLDYSPLLDDAGDPAGVLVLLSDVSEKIQTERRAQRHKSGFFTVTQALPNHVWTATPDGMLDWFNEQAIAYTGLGPGAGSGNGWTAAIHPDDQALTLRAWRDALKTETLYEVEFRIRRADGAYRWHIGRALPVRDENGRVERWIGTNTDIHERKLAEDESTQDRNRMWSLSQEYMLIFDQTGTITASNPAITKVTGWTEEDLVGQSLMAFLHPDDLAATAMELFRLASGMSVHSFETRCRMKDGSYREIDWAAVPEAGRVHAVGRDITEERKTMQALAASTAERDRIWRSTNDLMGTGGLDGYLKAVNPAWGRLLGYTEEALLARSYMDLFDPADHEKTRDALAWLAEGKALRDFENRIIHADGTRSLIAWVAEPVGDIFYLVGRNVTEQRAAEDALRQAQKMEAVGQLTGGIAHDFNNLLQGITGSLDLLQKRIGQGRVDELDRFITGAMGASSRASALTHRLLAFSRRQPLDPRPVRANPLISSMEELLRRTMGERIELDLALGDEEIWLTLCDPNQLENAVLNLAINARDAMPRGGRLTIGTSNAELDDVYTSVNRDMRPGHYVCIRVSDTGTGMSQDTIQKAFEPFFTTKPIGQGTGLGLSMIYGFARQSGGYAKIQSELGRGTTVKLFLPRHRGDFAPVEPRHDRQPVALQADGEIVLVVEDEPVVRGLIVEVLKDLGYAALEASDGPSGLDLLQSNRRIDLLITDIGLPGLNGRQIAEAARLLRPDLKILFMTGYAESAALAEGFLEHGMAMIVKPFAMDAMVEAIQGIFQEG
jgi:PAS domain S-box-containing protein